MDLRRLVPPLMMLAALALVGPPAKSQEPGPDRSAAALGEIDASLKKIVALLRAQVDHQRAEIALRRLDIARRDLADRERELHKEQGDRDRYVRNQAELEARKEMFATPEWQAETNMKEEQVRYMRTQVEVETESLKQNLWRTDQRILDLQQQTRRIREDLEVWEAMAAEALDER